MYKIATILAAFILFSMISIAQTTPKRIAFSKAGPDEKYKLYIKWLSDVNPGIEYVDLNGMSPADAVKELQTCQGLVVTGGADVYPSLYGREKDATRCGPFDRKRDGVEMSLLKAALEKKMPIFAICRGAQILNVLQGGSLIIDIPSDYPTTVQHTLQNPEGARHDILIEKKSMLFKLMNTESCLVNSYHHQAVDKLAPVFVPMAKAKDGIIEAYTWKEAAGKSFLIAVQWHPERLVKENNLSKRLAELFLSEVMGYQ